jgi:hypothetical protein
MSSRKLPAVHTPNARLFATEGTDDDVDAQRNKQARRVKNHMSSNIFGYEADPKQKAMNVSPRSTPVANMSSAESDSGSETASIDGDRLPAPSASRIVSSPISDVRPLKNKIPPGGYSSPLW